MVSSWHSQYKVSSTACTAISSSNNNSLRCLQSAPVTPARFSLMDILNSCLQKKPLFLGTFFAESPNQPTNLAGARCPFFQMWPRREPLLLKKHLNNEQRSRDAAAKRRVNTSVVGKSNNY